MPHSPQLDVPGATVSVCSRCKNVLVKGTSGAWFSISHRDIDMVSECDDRAEAPARAADRAEAGLLVPARAPLPPRGPAEGDVVVEERLRFERPGFRVVVVGVRGELDLVGAGQLLAQLSEEHLERSLAGGSGGGSGHVGLVLDLDGVTFLDSSGLRALVTLRRRLGEGRRLVLAGARPQALQALELTGVSQLLVIAPTVSDAVVSIAGEAGR